MIFIKNNINFVYKISYFFIAYQYNYDTDWKNFLVNQYIYQELTAQAPDYAEFQRNLQQVNKDLAELDA
jgi:hypothetical protein